MPECTANKYNNCFGDELYADDSGKKYCVLHAPISVRKKFVLEERFCEVFKNKLKSFEFDFSGCQFDDKTKFYHNGGRDVKLIVRDCYFYHTVDLSNRQLGFSDFSGSVFYEGINFENSVFYNKAVFREVTFGALACFRGSIFHEKCEFSKAKYSELDFEGCEFKADCLFGFMDNIEPDKKNDRRMFDVNFTSIIIEARHTVEFHMCSLINCAFSPRGEGFLVISGSTLKNASFANADLSRCIFLGIDLSETFFLRSKVSETRFNECTFYEEKSLTTNRIVIFEERFLKNVKFYRDKGYDTFINFGLQRSTSNESLEETYCALKNNFEVNKDYVTADKFHFSEMEMRRIIVGKKYVRKENVSIFDFLKYFLRINIFSFYPWYKYVSGYGTSYSRSLVCIASSLVAFSMIYMFSGLPKIKYVIGIPNNFMQTISDFVSSFFFSLAILLPGISREYLSDVELAMTKHLSVIEFIIIWSLIPLFVFALKRHFKR